MFVHVCWSSSHRSSTRFARCALSTRTTTRTTTHSRLVSKKLSGYTNQPRRRRRLQRAKAVPENDPQTTHVIYCARLITMKLSLLPLSLCWRDNKPWLQKQQQHTKKLPANWGHCVLLAGIEWQWTVVVVCEDLLVFSRL